MDSLKGRFPCRIGGGVRAFFRGGAVFCFSLWRAFLGDAHAGGDLSSNPVGVGGGAGAEGVQLALCTIGLAGVAASSSMPNEQMAEARPKRGGDPLEQVGLDFEGIRVGREPESLGKALDVRVNDDSCGGSEGVS